MNNYDYFGDFEVFRKKLRAAGINDDEHCIDDYAGLTYDELNALVSLWIAKAKREKEGV